VLCGRVVKVLMVGELLSLYRGGGARGDAAADEFNQCRATTKSQRYLDNLYRCLPGRYPDVVTPPPIWEPSIVMTDEHCLSVCLSVCVCLSAIISSELQVRPLPNFCFHVTVGLSLAA